MMPAGTAPLICTAEGAAPMKAVDEAGGTAEVTAGVVETWMMELEGVGWLELLGVMEGTETEVVDGVGVDMGTLTISTVMVEV